jgi:hypothetical protein
LIILEGLRETVNSDDCHGKNPSWGKMKGIYNRRGMVSRSSVNGER